MHSLNRYAGLILVACIAAAAPFARAETPATALETATATLQAANDELHREDAAFRRLRAGAGLSAGEAEDYAAFVAGLRLHLLEQCEAVRALGGEDAVRKFDCVLLDRERASLPAATRARHGRSGGTCRSRAPCPPRPAARVRPPPAPRG